MLVKLTGIIVLVILVLLVAAFGTYRYRNIHWYDKYTKNTILNTAKNFTT